MTSMFEELMLHNDGSSGRVDLTESVRANKINSETKRFDVSKFRIESRSVFESETLDELDKQFAVDPESEEEGEVVLVIDPELSAEDELPEDAAENAIGDYVYKCPVCGSNYLCNCDPSLEENVEVDENGVPRECPICGDDADQILIGEIAPVEEAPGEEVNDIDPVDPEDAEDNEEVLNPDNDGEEEEDPEVVEESTKITESVDLHIEDDVDATISVQEEPEEPECAECATEGEVILEPIDEITEGELEFDETRFESLVNKNLDSTFKNSPKMKVESIKIKGDKLSIDYSMSLGNKSTKGTLHCEGFDINKKVQSITLKDKGIITESVGRESKFEARAIIRNGHLSIF